MTDKTELFKLTFMINGREDFLYIHPVNKTTCTLAVNNIGNSKVIELHTDESISDHYCMLLDMSKVVAVLVKEVDIENYKVR